MHGPENVKLTLTFVSHDDACALSNEQCIAFLQH